MSDRDIVTHERIAMMGTTTYAEFTLHVHKMLGDANRADLYTIGVWEQSVLRGICHAQPIEAAVTAVRNVLQEAGKAVEVGQQ